MLNLRCKFKEMSCSSDFLYLQKYFLFVKMFFKIVKSGLNTNKNALKITAFTKFV